jgi:D-alanyl-D-alanine carboxypeptidase
MTRTARALGMKRTTFRNPHGLPDGRQVTTARDLVRLALALQDRFPGYYHYFGERSFTYRGARYRNHNRLLGSVQGVDGIKTGYTRASGFNLVTNVRRDGRHIIAVVMGGKSAASRDAHMRNLIAEHLRKASRGGRSTPLLVVETGEAGIAAADARIPRARPLAESSPVLSYAPQSAPRDVVAAAMAEAAVPQGDLSGAAEEEADPIAERISAATETAALVQQVPAAVDAADLDRLVRVARVRAGAQDIIATGPAGGEAAPDDVWHIQIGAVPSADGAAALIAKAQAEMGPVLASLSPLTQEITHRGSTLYRARFAGFADKEEARATCSKLKQKSFACLAVPN